MREAVGEIWDKWEGGWWAVITTNGSVRKDGCCVMGRGIAYQASRRFPGLSKALGDHISARGNVPAIFADLRLATFPVKRAWWEAADRAMIADSATFLGNLARGRESTAFAAPRFGCGNGRLDWERDIRDAVKGLLPDNVWVFTQGFDCCERCGSRCVTTNFCRACNLRRKR